VRDVEDEGGSEIFENEKVLGTIILKDPLFCLYYVVSFDGKIQFTG